jgi:hypothetical protein
VSFKFVSHLGRVLFLTAGLPKSEFSFLNRGGEHIEPVRFRTAAAAAAAAAAVPGPSC